MKTGFSLTLSVLTLAGAGVVSAAEFATDVLPILTARCKDCHMEGKKKGGVALDLEKISKSVKGKTIVPGDADKSELVKVLLLKEGEDDRMPPKGPSLSEEEIGKIKSWIAEGAKLPEAAGADGKKEEKDKPEEKAEAAAAAPEQWTSTGGTSITATLMRVDAARKTIVLKKEDGTTMEVPIAKLDEDSKGRAKAFWEAHK